jgi:GT2 family glycosyltransferase
VNPKFSIVIPTLNEETLSRVLEAVLCQRRQADEVIVVGRDERGVTRNYSAVKFVDTGKPVCAAAARNRGISESSGDIIVFTDADCIPDPDWLEQHIRAHAEGAQVVGGAVALAGTNYWAQSDNVSMFHDFVTGHPRGERALLPTLNLSVQRTVIDAVGYMDETFPGAAAEDSDWTVRMRLAGYPLLFEPAAVIRHAPARTSWSDVVRHWRNLGYSAIRVRLRYPTELRTPAFARHALLLRLLSPFVAARITLGIYMNPIFWPHLHYLPVVYATKIIYCFGAAASVESGFAFSDKGT